MYFLDSDHMSLLERGGAELERGGAELERGGAEGVKIRNRLRTVAPDEVATTIISYDDHYQL